ncbi:ferric citrate ABC transporter ATP-binding protein FecE [Clostridia bacterium]|nr:ferric citrate ABC transporter ATP-binding protein FecE [Clostridia bacterium]
MLELFNLHGGYSGCDTICDVSLCFPKGQITAIVGQNGCGKSTLLKLACGQLTKSDGKILLCGDELADLHRKEIAQKISYLPQMRTVPDITAESLVLHGRFPWLGYPRVYTENDRKLALDAMERVGVASVRKKLLTRLSGGERQKVYLAMLIAQNTDVVLLDEPTTYLDIEHQLELIDLLTTLKLVGKTVALVLHDLNMALTHADRIAVMQKGRLLATDTAQGILQAGVLEIAFGVKVQLEERYCFEKLCDNK